MLRGVGVPGAATRAPGDLVRRAGAPRPWRRAARRGVASAIRELRLRVLRLTRIEMGRGGTQLLKRLKSGRVRLSSSSAVRGGCAAIAVATDAATIIVDG